MDRVTRSDLRELCETDANLCMSLYMPMVKGGQETRQNPIRFKNMLQRAERELSRLHLELEMIDHFLEDARRLLQDRDFFRYQSDGLSMFISESSRGRTHLRYYRVPCSFREIVAVGKRFHLIPLIPVVQEGGRYLALTVSLRKVRLFEATNAGIDEIDLRGEQALSDERSGLLEALNIDELEQAIIRRNFRPASRNISGAAGKGGSFGTPVLPSHGLGDAQEKKKMISQYMRKVCAAIQPHLNQDHIPLVFLGAEHFFPIFSEVCNYSGLLEEPVAGNFDEAGDEEIWKKSFPVVRQYFQKSFDARLKDFHEKKFSPTASSNIKKILAAAEVGQVATLILNGEREISGADAPSELGEDLVNQAVTDTLLHGGEVYAVDSREKLGHSDIAALFRYPMGA